MNKFIFSVAGFLVASAMNAQVLTFNCNDTVAIDVPGAGLYLSAKLVNSTSAGFNIDVIRVVNDTAPNWTTAFCLDGCYPPTVDSVRFFLWADSLQTFVIDFYTDTIPDTSSVVMKFKNVSNPSNVFYQKFYGITDPFAGVHEPDMKNTSVTIFPAPVLSGTPFTFRITDKYANSKSYSVLICDICGSRIQTISGLTNGDNYLSLNLTDGIYFYSLIQENKLLKTGKLAVSR
jgi:hypothetical protein